MSRFLIFCSSGCKRFCTRTCLKCLHEGFLKYLEVVAGVVPEENLASRPRYTMLNAELLFQTRPGNSPKQAPRPLLRVWEPLELVVGSTAIPRFRSSLRLVLLVAGLVFLSIRPPRRRTRITEEHGKITHSLSGPLKNSWARSSGGAQTGVLRQGVLVVRTHLARRWTGTHTANCALPQGLPFCLELPFEGLSPPQSQFQGQELLGATAVHHLVSPTSVVQGHTLCSRCGEGTKEGISWDAGSKRSLTAISE